MGTQPSPSLHPPQHPATAGEPLITADEHLIAAGDDPPNANPNLSMPKINDSRLTKKTKNRASDDSASSSSPIISPKDRIFNHNKRGIRISSKRRNPRFSVRRSASDVEAIALPLGMSIAAVLAQVLERKDLAREKTSVDQLAMICTSAVRESLSNVFGDKFDAFIRNFEQSFGSTLNTLRLIKHSSIDYGEDQLVHNYFDDHFTDSTPTISLNKRECEHLGKVEEVEDNQKLPLQRHMSQQLSTVSNLQSYSENNSMLSTIEKSVMEQSRANDLKSVEIGLTMRKLQLKETQLALDSDLNILERCKLSLGISRTSFKAEKFKNQLEETRHSELLRTCADFLVADLLIMIFCLGYGVYAFSYDKIHQLTKSCAPSAESKSWWIPSPMSSFNSGLQSLNCQVQVFSRMLFGVLMILAIAYVLIQRPAISTQAMPITFIVLLLGAGCGFAGKLCVDTLGGDGNQWLILWEVLCALHFFANVFTPFLFYILNGAIQVSQERKNRSIFPYWIRQWLLYLTLILVPVGCGLLPFASPRTWWEEHFSKLIRNHLLAAYDGNYDVGSDVHEL